ncbi:MAG: hypothetical protein ACHQF2_03455 [Flavobacteriales bacterium]
MRFVAAISTLLLSYSVYSQSSKLTLNGHYLGQNLYVQNPLSSTGVGFCTKQVFINGKEAQGEFNSSAYVIDFVLNGIKLDDSINVEIIHEIDCTPKVLQPMHPPIRQPLFELVSIKVDTSGKLTWVTKKETTKLFYTVEQYRWNKWITIGTVDSRGSDSISTYTLPVNIHSGENKFRVKQTPPYSKLCISKVATCVSPAKPPKVTVDNVKEKISFSCFTTYELYDQYGNMLSRGEGTEADLKICRKGKTYFLNYDNTDIKLVWK